MEAYGTTAFCDDIRTEIDGRTTLIGVYNYPLVFPQIPFVAQKLCFAISIAISRDEHIVNVRSMIFSPGDRQDTPSYISDANMYDATNANIARDNFIKISDSDVIPPFHVWLGSELNQAVALAS